MVSTVGNYSRIKGGNYTKCLVQSYAHLMCDVDLIQLNSLEITRDVYLIFPTKTHQILKLSTSLL